MIKTHTQTGGNTQMLKHKQDEEKKLSTNEVLVLFLSEYGRMYGYSLSVEENTVWMTIDESS